MCLRQCGDSACSFVSFSLGLKEKSQHIHSKTALKSNQTTVTEIYEVKSFSLVLHNLFRLAILRWNDSGGIALGVL